MATANCLQYGRVLQSASLKKGQALSQQQVTHISVMVMVSSSLRSLSEHTPSHARLLTRLSWSLAISLTGSRMPVSIRHTEVVSSTTFTALPLGGSAAPETCKSDMRQLELQLLGILHRVA